MSCISVEIYKDGEEECRKGDFERLSEVTATRSNKPEMHDALCTLRGGNCSTENNQTVCTRFRPVPAAAPFLSRLTTGMKALMQQ